MFSKTKQTRKNMKKIKNRNTKRHRKPGSKKCSQLRSRTLCLRKKGCIYAQSTKRCKVRR